MSRATYQKRSNSAYNRARRKKSAMLYLVGTLSIVAVYAGYYLVAVKNIPNSLAACIVIPPCIVVIYLACLIRDKIKRRYLGQGIAKVDDLPPHTRDFSRELGGFFLA